MALACGYVRVVCTEAALSGVESSGYKLTMTVEQLDALVLGLRGSRSRI